MTQAHDPKLRSGGGYPTGLEPPPDSLLDTPLDYILADHFRQRCLCAELRGISQSNAATRVQSNTIASYLRQDLPRHHRDEDEDIYPILLRRVRPEDEIGGILERLASDHRQTETQAGIIAEAPTVPKPACCIDLNPAAVKLIRSFAATEHRTWLSRMASFSSSPANASRRRT